MFSRNYKARTENRNEFLIDSIKVSVENWATDEYTLIHVPQNSFNYKRLVPISFKTVTSQIFVYSSCNKCLCAKIQIQHEFDMFAFGSC